MESSPSAAADPTGGMAMSKTHSKMAKALSVFLCALMVLSTVCFFNPFPALKANAAVDVTKTLSAKESNDVTFNVPESIYLKPGSSSFQYFLANNVNSNGAAALASATTAMTISASSPYAENMKLTYTIESTGKKADGSSVAISGKIQKNGADIAAVESTSSVSLALNSSNTFSGYSDALQGSEAFIKWALTYTVKGKAHTIYAYTSLYIPYLGQAGVSAHSRHKGTYANPENWSYSFLTGGHSVTGGTASSKFVSNKAVNKDAKTAADAVFVAPLVEFTGGNKGSGSEDVEFPFNQGKTIPWGSYFYTDAFTTAANGGVAIKENITSDVDYVQCNDSDLGVMKITIDTSRFPNYNQVPNLSAGWAQFRHDRDGGESRLCWISGLNGSTASDMSQSGLTGATITTAADTSSIEGNVSWARGLYALNGAVTSGDHLMVFCYRNAYKPYVGNPSIVRTYAGVKLNVAVTNKTALRTLVFNSIYHGYTSDMSATYGAAYETAMNNASKVLSDQFATSAQIKAAYNSLNTAVANALSEFKASLNGGRTNQVDIYAVVPETVYLKPTTGTMKDSQYFINNKFESSTNAVTLDTSTSASGNFYFKCTNATKVKIIISNADVASVTSSVSTGSGTGSILGNTFDNSGGLTITLADGCAAGTISSLSLKNAISAKSIKTIEWKFIYTLTDGTTEEYVSNYTVAYAPYIQPVGVGIYAKDDGTQTGSVETLAWWQGVQGYSTTKPSTTTGDSLDSKSKDAYPNPSNFSPVLGVLKTGDASIEDYFSDTASQGMTEKTIVYANKTKNGGGKWVTVAGTAYPAVLAVDSSRYTNLNQIPNLKVGYMLTRYSKCDKRRTWFTTVASGTCYHGLWVNDDMHNNTLHSSTSKNDWTAETLFENNSLNYAITKNSSKTVNFYYKGSIEGQHHRSILTDAYVGATSYCPINLYCVNKTDLRDVVRQAIKPGYQDDWMADVSNQTFASLLKKACEVLGNPTASQTEVDNAKNNLTKAITNNFFTSDAKATHRALVKTVSANGTVSGYNTVTDIYLDKAATVKATVESKTYEGSDNVMISANDFAGYTYKGYKLNGAASFPNGSYDSTNNRELYLRVGKSLHSSGKDNLVFFYEAPDATLTIDLDGGVYPVNDLITKITATTGSVFAVQAPTRSGYTFKGWRLDGAGNLANGTYTFGLGDGKLTAQWEAIPTESTELIVDPAGGTMKENELLFIEHGAASASGDNGNGTLTYNITDSDDGRSLSISGHYKGFTYGEAYATGERTQIIPVWVYLEDGKSYTISWNTDNDITEFFLFKNGDLKNRVSFSSGANHSFSRTFTAGAGWYYDSSLAESEKNATGWYQLRLDQNMPVAAEGQPANEGDYNITGLTIVANDGAKLGYKQAAETTVFISEPVRDGYKFAGWSGLVNGTMSRVDPDETNINGGYLYTFKGKADTLVAQWVDAVYEIGFDNLFLATEWAEGKYTSASNDVVGFDKDNDIITYKNNKNADDKTDSEARRAESDYRITGLVPGREYVFSYDFASNYAGSAGNNDGNTYVFAHFYDENGKQINIKNSSINYGAQGEYVGKYVVRYTNPDGSAAEQITPSEWTGSDTRMFSGLQMVDVLVKDGYGHSDIIFTAPEGTVSMDIAFGAQAMGQTASFKNVQISEYDRVNPVTDYSAVQKTYDKDTTVFGTLATAKKLGYDFKGWFTGKNGTGTQITAQTPTASYHKKFTVWSNWEEIQYTVTYDAAGGTLANGTVNPTKYTINTAKVTAAAAPSKKGYTFKGWAVTKVNTAVHADNNWTEATVAAGTEFNGKLYGDVKLTAVWEENASNVVVVLREQNADGSYTETGIINGKKLDGDVIDLSAQVAAKTGFKAAAVTNNGSEFTLSNGKFTVAGGTSYNIIITRDRETYTFTVQYKMSDGTTAPAGVTKTLYYGQSASVTSPDKPGYTPDKKIATVNAISANTTVTVTYTLNTYNVTVHYVYEDGTKAADDKTIKVDYNKSYSVDSPSIVGFTADKLDVSGVMGIGDVEATVTYKINSHKLTIIYKYAENEKASTSAEYNLKYGTTYSYDVPEVEGFTASPAKVEGTMADGDVTVTVTYTIKKFTVKFSDWDGKLLKSQEVKWGADAEAPANPAREGYTFTGWSGSYTNIKADTDIKALYTINTYTLSFNTNGGTAVSNITAAYAIPVTAPVTTRTGYTFVKWTGDDGSDFPSVMPAKNIEFTASWTANSYSIVFDANGGTGTTAPVNAVYDSEATLTANGFERVGYHFAGWNTAANGSGTSYADKAVVKNLASENGAVVKLYAVWEANNYTVIYKADGKEVGRQTYKFGEAITPIANPTKEGYTFKGWKESLPAVMPANDITVEAVFEINSYKLIYMVDGAEYRTETVEFGAAVTAIPEPAKTGYTFSGWKNVPDTMPAHDVTVTGTFTVNTYKLTYIVDGKEYKSYDVAFGAAVTPEAAPTKQGYTFVGWTPELPGTMPANDVTVTAKWTANSDTKVTLIYEFEGLDGKYAEKNRAEKTGTTDTLYTVADADKVGSEGFTLNESASVLTGTVKADGSLELVLKYDRNTYTLTYEVDGKQYGEKQPHKFGSAVTMLEEPTKEGYTFSGWDKTLTEMPANDVTVKGTFGVNTYKLTYVIDGEEYRSYDVAYGTAITPEAAPTKEGYTFSGWSEIPGTMPANDVTVTANWIANGNTKVTLIYEFEGLDGKYAEKNRTEKTGTTDTVYTVADADKSGSEGFTLNESASVLSGTVKADGSLELVLKFDRNTYTLTYEVDGEQYGEKQTYKFGYEVAAPGKPEKTGYTFSGWDKEITDMPANDVTVKGSFTVNTYSVVFMPNGGKGEMAAESFRYDEEKALSGNEFTRTGYTFAGWSTTANGENGYNYTDREVVSKLCTANDAQYVLYAQWAANTYTVTFNKGADDATGTMADQTFTYDEAAVLSENKFARTGYDFVGWTDGKNTYTDAQEVLNLASSGTVTLTAVWDAKGDTKVTIVFETENLDGTYSERSRIERNGITDTVYTVADADMTKLDGFTVNKENSVLSGTVKADGSLVLTVKYDRNTYTLTYEVDGEQYGENQTYKFGSAVTMLEEPTKEGYTFSGWDKTLTEMPANDVTVKGTFGVNTYKLTYVVDGEKYRSYDVAYGTAITPEAAPAKVGYTFSGWSEIPGTMPANDVTVKGTFTVNTYKLTYVVDGEEYRSYDVAYGTAITPEAAPAKEGYTFSGWSDIPGTMPANDVTVNGTFAANTYFVEFNANDGTGSMDKQSFVYDAAQRLTANAFTKDGFVFAGWNTASDGTGTAYDDKAEVINLTTGKVDVVLYAQWKKDANGNGIPDENETPWNVTYAASNGGSLNGNTSEKVLDGMKPVNVPAPQADTGYAFRFWTLADGTKVVPADTVIKADTHFTAVFGVDANHNGTADEDEGKFTVTYDMNGSKVTELVLAGLAPAAVPGKDKANKTKPDGKCFAYWTLDGEKVDPSTVTVNGDITFTAVYAEDLNGNEIPDGDEAHYTVTYDKGAHGTLTGTTTITVVKYLAYSTSWEPTVTPDKGYMFKGWDNIPEKITENVVITALYGEDKNGNGKEDGTEDDPFYTVTFVDWNGTELKTVSVLNGMSAAGEAPTGLTRDYDSENHYSFSGWDKDITDIQSSLTVTAQYTAEAHTYGEWKETTAPTCTEDGEKVRECECGASETAAVGALGHDWGEWTETKKATCTEKGEETRTCQRDKCGVTETRPTDLAKHTPGEAVKENIVPAACETDGSHDEVVKCSVCGTEISRVTVKDGATGHKAEVVPGKEATCTETGLTAGEKCSVCGKELKAQEVTPALGHDWGEWTETKKATCTEKGEETRTCQRDKCGVTETRPTDLAKHTPGEAVKENIVPAACETDGSHDEVVKCSVCGTEISRVTVKDGATGHKAEVVPGKEATCTETGLTAGEKCSVCGKELKAQEVTPALGHDWGEWTETKKATCTEKGEETRICQRDKCGVTETRPTDLAKHTPGEAVKENIVPATCETDGSHDEVVKCSVCGTEISRTTVTDKAIGHKYGEWTVVTPATCTAEGLEQRVCANDASHVETRTIPVAKHTEKTVPGKEATCTEPGMTDAKVCEKCGKTLVEATEIPALGHEWGDWKVTVAPTYTSTGTAMRECSRCGKTEEKELPAYDHENDYLEIIAPDAIRAGTEVDIKAMRMPAETLEADAKWTSSDDSILTYFNGKFYAFAEGTVTLTAVTADGTLKAEKVITVLAIDYGNARIIKFQNMRKMDYTVAGFYKVYNDGAIYWSRTSECPFTVYTYSNFNYPDFIVYLDGRAIEADENGIYHIPAGTKNVVVSIAGATTDTDKPDDGSGSGSTGSKVSFWELIVRFFKKLFSIFKRK